jgi:hypothetical protein
MVLGILSNCESLRDLERFTRRHHPVLTESLGIELKRLPSDSAFRYFFLQVDMAASAPPSVIGRLLRSQAGQAIVIS